VQEEKEDDRLNSGARQSARCQIRQEQRTIRELCVDKESWVIQALERIPPPLKTRMELRMAIFHERLDAGSPLYQTLIKVGVSMVQFTGRTRTMAALYAVKGWEDPLSFQECRLTGTYLFSFTSSTFLTAETEKERLCPCGKQLDEGVHHVQCCAKHTRRLLHLRTSSGGILRNQAERGNIDRS